MFTTTNLIRRRIRWSIPVLAAFLALYVIVPITLAAASGPPTPTG